MRRFELVEGTSAKFWSAQVEGSTFTVVYGRLGTAGQRKEKPFSTPAAAQKEHDKKVAEKLREGYHEVAADAATQAAPGAKGAAAAAAPLQLPARLHAHHPTADQHAAVETALKSLGEALGSRSWVVARAAQKARRALRQVSGAAIPPSLQSSLENVLVKVAAPRAAERLPLRHAMGLVRQLDAAVFAKAAGETWKAIPATHPAGDAVAVLRQELGALSDPELAFRVAEILTDPSSGGWQRRWTALRPHFEAYLVHQHSSVKAHLSSVATAHPGLAERTRALAAF